MTDNSNLGGKDLDPGSIAAAIKDMQEMLEREPHWVSVPHLVHPEAKKRIDHGGDHDAEMCLRCGSSGAFLSSSPCSTLQCNCNKPDSHTWGGR